MPTSITRRDYKKTWGLPTTRRHVVRLQPFHGHVLEVDDVHFHHNSAVLLPHYGHEDAPPAPDGSLPGYGLGVLTACLDYAGKHPDQKLLIAGHADTSGSDPHNFKLSKQRADAVLHVLLGERDPWVAIATATRKVEDYQLILKWIDRVYHWDCDPGKVDDVHGPETDKAVRAFQKAYNEAFGGSLAVDGVVGPKTWGAIFDVYMDVIQNQLETDEAGLAALRSKLKFLDSGSKTVGCGEQFPIEEPRRDEYRSATNRRVELLFFEPGQEPQMHCGPCEAELCEIYNPLMYEWEHMPVTPFVPKPISVCLKLVYLDPEGAEKVFPPDFPVIVVSEAGDEIHNVAADGKLKFGVPLGVSSFTLRFEAGGQPYIASAPPGSTDPKPERMAAEADLKNLDKQNFRYFLTPGKWSLKESDWTVDATSSYDTETAEFKVAARLGACIGSAARPVKLGLDPYWQFLRFEFFDRYYGHGGTHNHKRIDIPALAIDGWRTAGTPKPDTRCRWTIKDSDLPKSVHCLPWIIQFTPDGTPDSKPDKGLALEFRTEAKTFVISDSDTSRKIDQVSDAAKLKPGPERLKYYDLPQVWKSKGYYSRSAIGLGYFFEDLTLPQIQESLQPGKWLAFSLDDIVLTDQNLDKYALGANELPALFFHRFEKSPVASETTSEIGLYSPGSDKTKDYFPYSDVKVSADSYMADYPNWTRLVITKGNLFDIFDQRTPDRAGVPAVGARAAVRWVNATANAGGVGLAVGDENKFPIPARKDAPATDPLFSLQPVLAQQGDWGRMTCRAAGTYQEWGATSYTGDTLTWGRTDVALLRCCDWYTDNGIRELAVSLNYFRYRLDFSAGAVAAANQGAYRENVVTNIPPRWNGPTDPYNAFSPRLAPQDPNRLPMEAKLVWFVQDLPLTDANYKIKVTGVNRSYMGWKGESEFGPTADQPDAAGGSLVAAHESGHGDGLPDDYNERWFLCSYWLPGFASWVGGDPYVLDDDSMMNQNKSPRPRHYWHVAEWVRTITGVDMMVKHGAYNFKLPHHPSTNPLRTYLLFPLFTQTRCSVGHHGRFDLYLLPLGDEHYRETLVAGKTFDGILLVVVKMRFRIDTPGVNCSGVATPLEAIRDMINDRFNKKFEAAGTVGPVTFEHCLVRFSPRFLVETYTSDRVDYLRSLGLTIPATGPTAATSAQYAAKVAEVETSHPRHCFIRARETYPNHWTADEEMELRLSAAVENDFENFFGDMVGLRMTEGGHRDAATVQERIVRLAIPDGTVTNI